ncbi:hypothetical protein [Dictyobacter halimunensis]
MNPENEHDALFEQLLSINQHRIQEEEAEHGMKKLFHKNTPE